MKVALIQSLSGKTKLESLDYFSTVLKGYEVDKLDVICLPELWYNRVVKDFEEEFPDLLQLAKEKNSIVISGAFFERIEGDLFISCPVISKKGKILGRQLKIHPFGSQAKKVNSGKTVEIFNFGKFKSGVVICYDLVFPEVSRVLALKGADILFFPSKIITEGIKPWHTYIQARALENRIPVVAPNICGKPYGGQSILVDFNYIKKHDIALAKVKKLAPNPHKYVTTIDLETCQQIRKHRFRDLKLDLYHSL